jgi:hypothetical protein
MRLRKKLLYDIKDIFKKYRNSQDKINLKEKWCNLADKEEKFLKCIAMILDKNSRQQETFSLKEEILDNLQEQDIKAFYKDNHQHNICNEESFTGSVSTVNGYPCYGNNIAQQRP